jgi:hypothetical protein
MMGLFDDDDGFFGSNIEEIFNKLAGGDVVEYSSMGPGRRRVYRKRGKGSFEKFFLDRLNARGNTFFVFDLSGMDNVSARVSDEKVLNRNGREVNTGNKLLEVREKNLLVFSFPLENLSGKGMETNFNNGILEVSFKK